MHNRNKNSLLDSFVLLQVRRFGRTTPPSARTASTSASPDHPEPSPTFQSWYVVVVVGDDVVVDMNVVDVDDVVVIYDILVFAVELDVDDVVDVVADVVYVSLL